VRRVLGRVAARSNVAERVTLRDPLARAQPLEVSSEVRVVVHDSLLGIGGIDDDAASLVPAQPQDVAVVGGNDRRAVRRENVDCVVPPATAARCVEVVVEIFRLDADDGDDEPPRAQILHVIRLASCPCSPYGARLLDRRSSVRPIHGARWVKARGRNESDHGQRAGRQHGAAGYAPARLCVPRGRENGRHTAGTNEAAPGCGRAGTTSGLGHSGGAASSCLSVASSPSSIPYSCSSPG
jgi:hypothetical protein